MKRLYFVASVLLGIIPLFSHAQLVIKGSPEIPQEVKARMEQARHSPRQLEPLPSFETLKQSFEQAQPFLASQPPGMPEPLTHPLLVQHGCDLVVKAPSGVERQEGGLHGISALYQCRDGYVQVYEYDYTRPLTQVEGVIDDDYARDPQANLYTVKAFRTERDGRTRTALRWINPHWQIILEVYPDVESQSVVDSYREIVATAARTILE